MDCMIAGDSIAKNVWDFMRECRFYGRGGIMSSQMNAWYPREIAADVVVLSMSTNDHPGVATVEELQALRQRVTARRVFWILPAIKPRSQAAVRKVAGDHGDIVLEIPSLQSDKIHPSWKGCEMLRDTIRQRAR